MKLSKRLTALFAAVLMAVTVFLSAMPAYALVFNTEKMKYSESNYATAYVASKTRKKGTAQTTSTQNYNYLYVAAFGNRCDKNGEHISYVSGPGKSNSAPAKTSGVDSIPEITSGTDYYCRVASANVAKYTSSSATKSTSIYVINN